MTENMQTFFDNFPHTPEKDALLEIKCLLQFTSHIVSFCEMQGKALYLIKSDVGGNIKKIKNSCEKFQVDQVGDMLDKEKEADYARNDASGSVGLLWLYRAVELILAVMKEMVAAPDTKMSDVVHAAYEKTLRKHHNLIMRKLFEAGLHLFPDKDTFLLRMAYNKPNMNAQVMGAMKEFLVSYGNILDPVRELLIKYGLESSP